MEINVNAFQEAIAAGNYETNVTTITPDELTAQGTEAALAPVFAALDAAIENGKLIQADLVIETEEPTTVRLETGVINLPFADSKKVSNFLDPEQNAPLRVNLIVISPYVNRSGLRIDIVAPADEYVQNPRANQAAVIADVNEKLARIEAERLAPTPVEKPAPASRAKTTRKTTAKKTTRKTTTRKTTAKKTTAKKPAAKTAKATPRTRTVKAPTTRSKGTIEKKGL